MLLLLENGRLRCLFPCMPLGIKGNRSLQLIGNYDFLAAENVTVGNFYRL
jgi:hypothetical protein